MPKPKTVEKMLSPEEKTLLANIKSLVDQIEMIEGGGGEEEDADLIASEGAKPDEDENIPAPIEKVMSKVMNDDPLDDEEKETLKSHIAKDENASEDAEARAQGEQEETTEDAISVVKALVEAGLLQKPKAEKAEEANPVLTVLEKLTKVMKDRMDEQDNAISGILEGLGISKEILTEVDKVEKDKGKRVKDDSDTEAVLSMLKKALKGERTEPVAKESNKQLVRKDLKGVMSSLFTQ